MPGSVATFSSFSALLTTLDFVFCTDILVSFNTGYRDESHKLIKNHKMIAKHFAQTSLLADALASFPFDLILFVSGISQQSSSEGLFVLKFMRLLKVLRLKKVLASSATSSISENINPAIRTLIFYTLSLCSLPAIQNQTQN